MIPFHNFAVAGYKYPPIYRDISFSWLNILSVYFSGSCLFILCIIPTKSRLLHGLLHTEFMEKTKSFLRDRHTQCGWLVVVFDVSPLYVTGKQFLANIMFNYYDHNSDNRLDDAELRDIEHRDHLSQLSHYCSLSDMLRREDTSHDGHISLAEFHAAFSESQLLRGQGGRGWGVDRGEEEEVYKRGRGEG